MFQLSINKYRKSRLLLLLWAFLFLTLFSYADGENDPLVKKFAISGHIKDATTGEDLIGATIYIKEIGSGTITNTYGFYSISLPQGIYNFVFSYIGYQTLNQSFNIQQDTHQDIA